MKRKPHNTASWLAEGRKRFGDDYDVWSFRCPSCGHDQTLRDFLAVGMPMHMAQNHVFFSCIGTWNKTRAADAGKGIVGFMDEDAGFGCDYRGEWVPNISPIEVTLPAVMPTPDHEYGTVYAFNFSPVKRKPISTWPACYKCNGDLVLCPGCRERVVYCACDPEPFPPFIPCHQCQS